MFLLESQVLKKNQGVPFSEDGVAASGFNLRVSSKWSGAKWACKHPYNPNHSLLEIFRHTDYVP